MSPSTTGCAQPWSDPDVATVEMNSGNRVKTAIATPSMTRSITIDRALAELMSSSSPWTLALRMSQRVPTTSVSYRTTGRARTATSPRVPVDAGVEPLRGVDDPAIGVAEGDGDRVATAHEDALDERLAAVGIAGHGGKSTRADDVGPESRRRAVGPAVGCSVREVD